MPCSDEAGRLGFNCDEMLASCELTPERALEFLQFNYLAHFKSMNPVECAEAIEVRTLNVGE